MAKLNLPVVMKLTVSLALLAACADRPEFARKAAESSASSDSTAASGNETTTTETQTSDTKTEEAQTSGPASTPSTEDTVVTTPSEETKETETTTTEPAKPSCTQNVSMVSFNLKFDKGTADAAKDVNGWSNAKNPRSQRMKNILQKIKPDLMGTQEGYEHQIKDIKTYLPEYDFWGVGRDDGKAKGEFAGIFYSKAKYKFIEGGHFWLSLTPDKPGTTFAGEAHTRMASWMRVEDIAGKMNLLIVNTHWGLTDDSRLKSSELMIAKVKTLAKSGDKTIIMGDFNAYEDKTPMVNLRKGLELSDSYRVANPVRAKEESSTNGFVGAVEGQRIDHILVSAGIEAKSASIYRDKYDGLYPSDHYPVESKLCY